MKPRIDAHQHFWQYDLNRDTWITDSMSALRRDFLPEDLRIELNRNQVDASIAVQTDSTEAETDFLLDLAEQHSFIAGVVGWIDLRGANLPARLEHYSRFAKLCGFRHIVQSEPDNGFLLRDDVVRGIGHLQQFGFTYDILIYPHQMRAALELMERLPRQHFIIDHIAKPRIRKTEIATQYANGWASDLRAMASNPFAYCKVSGLVTEADWQAWHPDDFMPYLDVVFEAFGTDRILFGSRPARFGAGEGHGHECRAVLQSESVG
jgi:L-fuconolactonase